MSIDTHIEHDAHGHGGHDGGHHEPPEVVDGRQRMAIWLFISGDAITLSALLFTYLYLRGVNTGGHWMSMVGLPTVGPGGHSYAFYEALDGSTGLPDGHLITQAPLSAGLNWIVSILTLVSGLVVWAGEKGLRATKNTRNFSAVAWVATALVVVTMALALKQLHSIPAIFVAVNDSHTMSYTAYASTMMVIIGSGLVHLAILAFLGIGLAIRSARGAITGDKWFQARLVRLFWVWVGISAVIGSAVTTTINTIH